MDALHRLLAAQYIRRQAKQLARQLDGVRTAEDIEFVHRARVATRRLRAAIPVFGGCFARRRVRCWRKAMRRVATALSEVRDRDVQIEFLCGALSALTAKECFPGIARILVQLEHERERLQRQVVRAVDRLRASGVLRDMRRAARKILRRAKRAGSGDVPLASEAGLASEAVQPVAADGGRLEKRIEKIIRQRLERLLEHRDGLTDPADQKRHHIMRIAAKRLRYTLEISRPLYPGRFDEAVEAIKKVQTLLGDIHDCDVWQEHLVRFAVEERRRISSRFGHAGRFQHIRPGIEHLQKDRIEHRGRLFRELAEYWAELDRRGFWVALLPSENV